MNTNEQTEIRIARTAGQSWGSAVAAGYMADRQRDRCQPSWSRKARKEWAIYARASYRYSRGIARNFQQNANVGDSVLLNAIRNRSLIGSGLYLDARNVKQIDKFTRVLQNGVYFCRLHELLIAPTPVS